MLARTMSRLASLGVVSLTLATALTNSMAQNWRISLLAPRNLQAMAYESARGRVVLFGGYCGALLGDTWEWDGTRWTLRSSSGPAPRSGHGMAYDSARGRVVLFGGYSGSGNYLGDTWEWDGASWTQRASSGPASRYSHAIAYDSARGRVVLFGGRGSGGTYFGDTWEWDGTSWTQRASSGPAPRYGHSMACDSSRGKVVLFGGYNGGALGDTWEWDGTAWTQRASSGPAPRSGHAMAYDSARGRVVLFGRYYSGGTYVGDTWEWDGTSWTQRASSGPEPRIGHAMAYDSARRLVVLFGGAIGANTPVYLGDTWAWDGTGWSQRASYSGPVPREFHAMAYDSAHGRTVLFGGAIGSLNPVYLGDTWEWDGAGWTQRASSGPAPRNYHAMAYDSAHGRVVLFGGVTGVYSPGLGDTWEWDGMGWTQRASSGPPPRFDHAMAYDSSRGRVVLFGGTGAQPLGDTWEWDGASWSQRASSGPASRVGHAMAYDPARRRVVLFGGNGNGGNLGDTWEWDGASWTLRASSGPSARYGHAMAYDSARGRVVLFGGFNWAASYAPLGDTWEWDGASWTLRTSSGPGSRYAHAMAYDSLRGRLVLFGGSGAEQDLGDTWEYGSWCASDFTEDRSYGSLLFPPLCARDASGLPGGPGDQLVYNTRLLGVSKSSVDRFFLSSQGKQFSPLVVADAVRINGSDAGLGPYSHQPGIPPFLYDVPIEQNLLPLDAHDVTDKISPGSTDPVVFELLDTQREIYGNTAVYLVRDCGIWLDKNQTGQTRLNWVSQHVQVDGAQSNLDVVSGKVLHLHSDRNFSRACFLGTYNNTTQVVDTRPSPMVGDGYYYLVSGSCASPIGYGISLQGSPPTSVPRAGLPPAAPCP